MIVPANATQRPPGDGVPELELDRVSKIFSGPAGDVEALRDISFSAGRGELISILGPSGCGKTTILRIIAGLEQPTAGTILIRGQPINSTRTVSRDGAPSFAVVFQEPRLLPWRTVEENIRLPAPLASDEAIAQLYAVLHLADHRYHFPGELSLGLARRVALARAFAVEPELLLLDEPFVSLDAPLAAQLRRELAALVSRQPLTTLLVTHDASEAAALADVIFVFSPRPAHVVAEISLTTPRAERSSADIAAIASRIAGTT